LREIVDVDRLDRLRAVPGQRHERQSREPGEQRGARSRFAENKRRLHDHPRHRQRRQCVVGLFLRTVIGAFSGFVCAERGNLHDLLHARVRARAKKRLRRRDVQCLKRRPARFAQYADRVDDVIDRGELRQPRIFVVIAHEIDGDRAAADHRVVANAARHVVSRFEKLAQHVPADEARRAEQQNPFAHPENAPTIARTIKNVAVLVTTIKAMRAAISPATKSVLERFARCGFAKCASSSATLRWFAFHAASKTSPANGIIPTIPSTATFHAMCKSTLVGAPARAASRTI
jgi:hypothetical protein